MDVSPRFRQGNGMKSEGLVRLGRAVVAQRKRLGWATREAFEDNIDLTYRVLTDLENGNRKLGAKAYGQVERALRWEPGSIDDILAGGEPTVSAARHPQLGGMTIEEATNAARAAAVGAEVMASLSPQQRQQVATEAETWSLGRDKEPLTGPIVFLGSGMMQFDPIIELAVRLDRVRSDMPTGLPLEAADNIDVASDLADRAAAAMIGSRTLIMQMKRKYHEVLQERDAVRVKELRRQLVATRTDQGQQQSQDGQQQEKVTGEDDERGSENE